MTQRGRMSSAAVSDPDATRTITGTQGGDATTAPQGLTFGKMVDGGFAGKFSAQYRKVALNATATVYNVSHGLGYVPAGFLLVSQTNSFTPANAVWASSFEYDKWTASEIRIKVGLIVGSVAGTELWLLILGER